MNEYQELLVIPRNKNEDKEEMWGIQQIERENKKTEELDLMMECVRLYPDQFVRKEDEIHQKTFLKRVEEFFASQLLFHCEETEQTVVQMSDRMIDPQTGETTTVPYQTIRSKSIFTSSSNGMIVPSLVSSFVIFV